MRSGMIWRKASPTSALRAGDARALGVRRVAEQQVDAAVAELGEPADVGAAGRRPACGRACSRRCGGSGRRGVSSATATESGIECATRTNSTPERPELDRRALRIGLAQLGGAQQAVLVELRLDRARASAGSPRPPGRATSRSRYGSAPTWSSCPCVSTTARTRPVAVGQVREVGQDRGRRRGARRAGTQARRRRRSRSPSASIHGHVLADLAEAAERDDPGASGHRRSVGVGWAKPGSAQNADTRYVRLPVLAYRDRRRPCAVHRGRSDRCCRAAR